MVSVVADNKLFPIFLKLEQLKVLIVGGGNVGLEKINALLFNSPKTHIKLVAIDILAEIEALLKLHPNVSIHKRPFEEGDLEDQDILILAVNNKTLSESIKAVAAKKGVLTNVADTPDLCDFYLGSIVKKGDLKIAISTNGKSPTMAKRIKEILQDTIPDSTQQVLDNLQSIRNSLKGDFDYKVTRLNEITTNLKAPKRKTNLLGWQAFMIYITCAVGFMIVGHLLFTYIPLSMVKEGISSIWERTDSSILWFILGGFIAQMIDGALGMAYGVSATTFLLTFGITPAAASASVHASEIFTSGVSGLMHLKFGNVNTKLFKTLLIPGVIGAILGAYILSSLEEYSWVIKPIVATYTLCLGVIIIKKALQKTKVKTKIKRLGLLAGTGGFLDSIGGGGWGPIVSSTLIASGRNARYTIGSVNLTEFFVALASSITFIAVLGIQHWQIIAGLVIGGAIAAPIAAFLSSKLPTKTIMIMVGIIVIIVSLRIIYMMIGSWF